MAAFVAMLSLMKKLIVLNDLKIILIYN